MHALWSANVKLKMRNAYDRHMLTSAVYGWHGRKLDRNI
jgi:hypothetical protein